MDNQTREVLVSARHVGLATRGFRRESASQYGSVLHFGRGYYSPHREQMLEVDANACAMSSPRGGAFGPYDGP
jgi:hypothetical protein